MCVSKCVYIYILHLKLNKLEGKDYTDYYMSLTHANWLGKEIRCTEPTVYWLEDAERLFSCRK